MVFLSAFGDRDVCVTDHRNLQVLPVFSSARLGVNLILLLGLAVYNKATKPI